MTQDRSPIAKEGLPFIGERPFSLIFGLLGWKILTVLGILLTLFIALFLQEPGAEDSEASECHPFPGRRKDHRGGRSPGAPFSVGEDLEGQHLHVSLRRASQSLPRLGKSPSKEVLSRANSLWPTPKRPPFSTSRMSFS